MSVMNTYNYSKPRNFIKVDTNTPTANTSKLTPLATRVKPKMDHSDQYLESKVLSAKPEELTYMLYGGLVKFIKKAVICLETKDISSVNYNAQRAQDILSELRNTLNMDVPLSVDLDALYEYTEFKLYEANLAKDKSMFEEALFMAEEFRDAWKQAFNLS